MSFSLFLIPPSAHQNAARFKRVESIHEEQTGFCLVFINYQLFLFHNLLH